jgi:hypothetical protein
MSQRSLLTVYYHRDGECVGKNSENLPAGCSYAQALEIVAKKHPTSSTSKKKKWSISIPPGLSMQDKILANNVEVFEEGVQDRVILSEEIHVIPKTAAAEQDVGLHHGLF